jgi:hypothetical protein
MYKAFSRKIKGLKERLYLLSTTVDAVESTPLG